MIEPVRVLIVDDDRWMTKTLADILRANGYHAEEAYSGDQALQMVSERAFNCVFTDIKMPRVNGIDLY